MASVSLKVPLRGLVLKSVGDVSAQYPSGSSVKGEKPLALNLKSQWSYADLHCLGIWPTSGSDNTLYMLDKDFSRLPHLLKKTSLLHTRYRNSVRDMQHLCFTFRSQVH